MQVIGLCGGSGSGKGLVCSFFDELGLKCIDTDKVYHDLISKDSECTRELISFFGEGISSNSKIDRKKLRDIIFSSDDALEQLNRITHKHILAQVRTMIEEYKKQGYPGVIVDAPVLFESGFDKECDLTICVIADEKIRIERIINRDNITFDVAKARIDSQITNQELIRKCTYWVENGSTERELFKRVSDLYKTIFENLLQEI